MQISPLPDRRSHNCYSGCVSLVVERLGTPYSEPVALGLSGGLNLELLRLEDGFHFRPVRELHCVTEFLEARGVEVQWWEEASLDGFPLLCATQLARNLPVMIEYDGYFLPFTQIYRQLHERRIGLVVGLDDDTYHLTDPIYGVVAYPVPRDLLDQARTPARGACVKPAWYSVRLAQDADIRFDWETAAAAVRGTASHMLTTGAEDHGAAGMRNLAGRIEDIMHDLRTRGRTEAFSEELKQAAIAFSHYAEFLSVAAELGPQTQAWQLSAALADEIGRKLKIGAALAWKAGVVSPERQIAKLAPLFAELADNVEAAFSPLFRMIPSSEVVG